MSTSFTTTTAMPDLNEQEREAMGRLRKWIEILERETNLEHRDNDEQVEVEGRVLHNLSQAIRAALTAREDTERPHEKLRHAGQEALVVLAALKFGDKSYRHAPEVWQGILNAHDLLLGALVRDSEPGVSSE